MTEFAGAVRISTMELGACGRVLLMCEHDPRCTDQGDALAPGGDISPGTRLMRNLGLPFHLYMSLWRVNLCVDEWSDVVARERIAQLSVKDAPWDVFVMLGARACRVMKYTDGLMTWRREWRTPRVWVATPSPIKGRHWNDPGVGLGVRNMLTEVVPDIPWGSEITGRS